MNRKQLLENKELVIPTMVGGMILLKLWDHTSWGPQTRFIGEHFPFSLHGVTWLAFLFGLGSCLSKVLLLSSVDKALLSYEETTKTEDADLRALKVFSSTLDDRRGYFFKKIIDLLWGHKAQGADTGLLLSTLELQINFFLHQVDMLFASVKFMIWLIPSLGLLGTIIGFANSVGEMGRSSPSDSNLLQILSSSLAYSFDTTITALVLAMILHYLSQMIEVRFEKHVNRVGEIILDGLKKT